MRSRALTAIAISLALVALILAIAAIRTQLALTPSAELGALIPIVEGMGAILVGLAAAYVWAIASHPTPRARATAIVLGGGWAGAAIVVAFRERIPDATLQLAVIAAAPLAVLYDLRVALGFMIGAGLAGAAILLPRRR